MSRNIETKNWHTVHDEHIRLLAKCGAGHTGWPAPGVGYRPEETVTRAKMGRVV